MYKSNSSIFSNYNLWLNAVKNDKKTFDELKSIENDEKEIIDASYVLVYDYENDDLRYSQEIKFEFQIKLIQYNN